ncbi:MAG: polyphenol oxidase family protein [Acidimicrobiia bacterium]|nr:polyphenol oxidase family protein [Acidimicrobiia bacterium]
MIRPDGFRGAAFGTLRDGDARVDASGRSRLAARLGIPGDWAFLTQVHGDVVHHVTTPGLQGDGDAMFTTTSIPIAVATADCVPVILEGPGVVAVVHAGWRGAVAGVVGATLDAIRDAGLRVDRAAIGPAISPDCYEVGDEVADQLPAFVAKTRWGTQSIDLPAAVSDQLGDLPVWRSSTCTYTDERFASYRQNRTDLRQVAVAWLPS